MSPQRPTALRVGTLNLLGDAFNPFEFFSADAAFATVQSRALSLTLAEFENGCGDSLLNEASSAPAFAQFKEACSSGSVWDFFRSPDHGAATLENDNKLLSPRINLIVFAMRPHGSSDAQWLLLDSWQSEVIDLVRSGEPGSPYARDRNLLLWDLACNVAAASEPEAFRAVCRASYLNPQNFDALGQCFFDAAMRADAGGPPRPLVLGMQEWPLGDTPKGRAFLRAIAQHQGLAVLTTGDDAGQGIALVYSRDQLGEATLEPVDASTVMQACVGAANAEGGALDAKAVQGLLQTTARKVLVARFPQALPETSFLVVHAKEPKAAPVAACLAHFAQGLASASDALAAGAAAASASDARPSFVLMMDANLGKPALATAFADALDARGFESLPSPAVPTTTKQRTWLHGQCCDTSKCMKVVLAPKDKLAAARGTLSSPSVHPDLSEGGVSLPSAEWASDHALTMAVYTPAPPPADDQAAPSCSRGCHVV